MKPEIWGLAELAAHFRVSKQAMRNRIARGTMPPPDYELDCGPIWRAAKVKRWKGGKR